MTEGGIERTGNPAEVSRHVLRPAPPIRALGVAAVGSVLGAVLIVLSAANGWSGFVTGIGVIILILGLLLLALAIWTAFKMRVQVELTPTGYTFRTPAGIRVGVWAETQKVTTSETGRRLSLHNKDESVQDVISPVGAEDAAMRRLVADLTERLTRSRS
ncbi:MAG TPA: hypothetical protein GXZ30_01765 [Propionibacterium sp.]|jgi:membrane-bound ClpP family serine protease|nr:hypothetical protein [Propionibacterium sp.]